MEDGVRKVIESLTDRYREVRARAEKAYAESDADVAYGYVREADAYAISVDMLCDLIMADRPNWSAIADEIETAASGA